MQRSTSNMRASCSHSSPRAISRPVLAVKGRGTLRLSAQYSHAATSTSTRKGRQLVVAVDDTELSWESVKFTVEEIYRDGDVLHLLHVIPREDFRMPIPPAALGNMSYSSMDFEYEELLMQHAREFISGTMVGLADARKARCEIDLIHGSGRQSIGDAIISKSDAIGASMIVVPGHHSPSIWEQLFTGNHSAFSTHVAKFSRVPTLIYQPSMAQQRKQEAEAEAQLQAVVVGQEA